jgi:non-specific serine/threonine protein kinase
VLNGAGWIAIFQGNFGAAKTLLEEGLTQFRALEDKEGIASTLTNLGFVAMLGQRDDIPVPTLLEEARELRPGLRNRRTVAHLLILEGIEAASRGDLGRAVELHEEGLALLREVRDMPSLGGCLLNMGLFEVARADYSRGPELLREALRVASEADDNNIIQLALFGLANVASRRGQSAGAARLWGASEAAREAFGMRLSPMIRAVAGYEDNLSAARSQLDEAAFEEAWAEGKAMTTEQAIEYALSEEGSASASVLAPKEPPAGGPMGTLTRREREVVVLVARGLTNRQVSAELSISERTAGNHVARILRKLGLRSRAQIASWATERRLLAPEPG